MDLHRLACTDRVGCLSSGSDCSVAADSLVDQSCSEAVQCSLSQTAVKGELRQCLGTHSLLIVLTFVILTGKLLSRLVQVPLLPPRSPLCCAFCVRSMAHHSRGRQRGMVHSTAQACMPSQPLVRCCLVQAVACDSVATSVCATASTHARITGAISVVESSLSFGTVYTHIHHPCCRQLQRNARPHSPRLPAAAAWAVIRTAQQARGRERKVAFDHFVRIVEIARMRRVVQSAIKAGWMPPPSY